LIVDYDCRLQGLGRGFWIVVQYRACQCLTESHGMESGAEKMETQQEVGSHWNVWKTIEHLKKQKSEGVLVELEKDHLPSHMTTTTDRVVAILRLWAEAWAGRPEWQSFLNKRTFQHEVEESLVALCLLDAWRNKKKRQRTPSRSDPNVERFVAVDVCGGKGVFSMLLQYVAGLYWNREQEGPRMILDRIVMLEKATASDINWDHIAGSDPLLKAKVETTLPAIELWERCDLCNHDDVVKRLEGVVSTSFSSASRRQCRPILALTGIHLCRLLSPALIGIANHLMKSGRCGYLCVAPCCLPRIVRSKKSNGKKERNQSLSANGDSFSSDERKIVRVLRFEKPEKRKERLCLLERYEAAKRKNRCKERCFLCHSQSHWLRDCPDCPADQQERSLLLKKAVANTPCWKCGLVGHFKAGCPSNSGSDNGISSTLSVPEPPFVEVDVARVLQSPDPFRSYCELLASVIELPSTNDGVGGGQWQLPRVLETGLSNEAKHQPGNWNSRRKSVFIVAHSSTISSSDNGG